MEKVPVALQGEAAAAQARFETDLAARIPGLLADGNLVDHPSAAFHELSPYLYVGMAPAGQYFLPLGVLVSLWKQGEWTATCKHCGDAAFIVAAGGFALSGRHSYRAVCTACRSCSTGSKQYFSSLTCPARSVLGAYRLQFPDREVR